MYKVFAKDIPIILSTQKKIEEPFKTIPLKDVEFKKIVKKIFKGERLYVNIYHKNAEKLEGFLRKQFKVVEAAGGLVRNNKEEFLFIRRNKKWDLPKGKIENGETIPVAALREVMEETGIPQPEIGDHIETTYHIFQRNEKFRLKITYWFDMYSEYDGPFMPEFEEGIKKVRWKNFEKTQKALTNSYENIKLLFPENYLIDHSYNRIS